MIFRWKSCWGCVLRLNKNFRFRKPRTYSSRCLVNVRGKVRRLILYKLEVSRKLRVFRAKNLILCRLGMWWGVTAAAHPTWSNGNWVTVNILYLPPSLNPHSVSCQSSTPSPPPARWRHWVRSPPDHGAGILCRLLVFYYHKKSRPEAVNTPNRHWGWWRTYFHEFFLQNVNFHVQRTFVFSAKPWQKLKFIFAKWRKWAISSHLW